MQKTKSKIDCGLPQDPEVFYTEQAAGLLFEKSITTKEIGFRPKIETETWQQYHDHFLNYSNSEEVKYYRITFNV